MIGRLLRRLLRRLIRGLIRLRLVGVALLGLLVIAGIIGGFQLVQGQELSIPLPNIKHPPSSTENYLKGQQTYDAELIWNSFSDDARNRFAARGITFQDQQRQAELARQSGAKLEQINYVGGQSLPDGTSLQFYVVAARGPMSKPDVEYVTYIFTLDRSGKILKVQ